MAIPKRRLTLEEFLALPEEKPALEYMDGRVTQKVSPKGRHSRLEYTIPDWLNRAAEPLKLGLAFPELRTTHSGASPVPDVSYYRWDRIPRDETGQIGDDFLTPPDIAIEIASPGQSRASLLRRCRWYIAHGSEIALLVDPRDRSVHDLRGDHHRILRGDDLIDLSAVIPDLRLSVAALFATLRP
jgi:Uma2 family endonuclease